MIKPPQATDQTSDQFSAGRVRCRVRQVQCFKTRQALASGTPLVLRQITDGNAR